MDTTRYALVCKYGSLYHDLSREDLYRIKSKEFPNIPESEVWTVEYNFQTHDIDKGGNVVEREKPLRFYSANDLYQRTQYDVERHTHFLKYAFPELDTSYLDFVDQALECRILYSKDDHWLATLWFREKPFMVIQRFYETNYSRMITDPSICSQAMGYFSEIILLAKIEDNLREVFDADEVLPELTCFGHQEIMLEDEDEV